MYILILDYKNIIIIFFFSIFTLYNIPNIFQYLYDEKSIIQLPLQNIQGQLQQQQTVINIIIS